MRVRGFTGLVGTLLLLGWTSSALAQEAVIHHGFLFFANEKYTVDDQTFAVYKDGNKFADLIKENKAALAKFDSYEAWHTSALVASGVAIAGIAFGVSYYAFYDSLSRDLGDSAGLICFASGGGLFALSAALEFVAWGKISDAAHMHNRGLMDEGSASLQSLLPRLSLAVAQGKTLAALNWTF